MELIGGNQSVEAAVGAHDAAWQKLLEQAAVSVKPIPTTISWKVASKHDLYEILENYAERIEQVHVGTVNNRYIASAVLKQPEQGMPILKILERRPGSSDPLGLDSIDYLVPNLEEAYKQFTAAGLGIVKESNDVHGWLSLRFGDDDQFEAKLTDHLVLAVAQKELAMSEQELLASLKS